MWTYLGERLAVLTPVSPTRNESGSNGAQDASPGSWIFSQDILHWMADPVLRQQLPFLYQVFALYCQAYFRLTGMSLVPNGVKLFKVLTRWSQYLQPLEYLHLQLSQYEVYLNPIDPRCLQVVNELTSDQEDTRFLHQFLTPGDTFVDVGANHGSFAIVASKLLGPSGYIVAVEPQPVLAKAVEKSLKANALCPFRVYAVAMGNDQREIELLVPKDSSGSAGIFQEHSGTHLYSTIKVPLCRFDEAVEWQSFPGKVVVKLDVEGNELAFLEGARDFFLTRQPTLFMEINPGTLEASGTVGDSLKALLWELGYRQYLELVRLDQVLDLADLKTHFHRNIVLLSSAGERRYG